MEIELLEIVDFLAEFPPFDLLDRAVLERLSGKLQSEYARRGTVILTPGDTCEFLYVIRSGATQTHSPSGELLAHLAAGEAFGVHAMMNDGVALNRVEAIEDTLLYLLPRTEFDHLRKTYESFAYFYAPIGAERLRKAREMSQSSGAAELSSVSRLGGDDTYYTEDLKSLIQREPVTVQSGDSIQQVAQVMRSESVSCVVVMADDQIIGIVTDKDLRNRVVAVGADIRQPIATIQTPNPRTLAPSDTMFDALLMMTRFGLRHVPIVENGQLLGLITNSNLLMRDVPTAINLVEHIRRCDRDHDVSAVVQQMPDLMCGMFEAGASASHIGQTLSSIQDVAVAQLLHVAEAVLGGAPVDFAWVALGAYGRQEVTALAEAESVLIVSDAYDPQHHARYFEKLWAMVAQTLRPTSRDFDEDSVSLDDHMHGHLRCMTVSEWGQSLRALMATAALDQLLHQRALFDRRFVSGNAAVFQAAEQETLDALGAHLTVVQGEMARNCLVTSPPLGFFGHFVLIRSGGHKDMFNMASGGMLPMVDLARVVSLSEARELSEAHAYTTVDRLMKIARSGHVEPQLAMVCEDLKEAFETIGFVRLQHQVDRIRQGVAPDDFVNPKQLTRFTRSHLKDAFAVIRDAQTRLIDRFGAAS